jgi:hypothetical protein
VGRRIKRRRETRQAGLHALARCADHRLAGLARPGQHARAGQRAKHHGRHHGAALHRDGLHVEQHGAPGQRLRGTLQALRVLPAVGHVHFFDGGVHAVGGRNERGSAGDKAALDHARGLQQLAGHHHVHAAGQRRQRKHGLGCTGRPTAARSISM